MRILVSYNSGMVKFFEMFYITLFHHLLNYILGPGAYDKKNDSSFIADDKQNNIFVTKVRQRHFLHEKLQNRMTIISVIGS